MDRRRAGRRRDAGDRWVIALAIDYAGPAAGYWLPVLGRSPAQEWEIEGSHFAERFQLFIIIALGESIVVTGDGVGTADRRRPPRRHRRLVPELRGALVALLRLRRQRSHSGGWHRATTAARWRATRYTYVHTVMVAGIIVAAVGEPSLIAHPPPPPAGQLATIAGGTALYLAGHLLFRWRMAGSWSGKRVLAMLAIIAAGIAGMAMPALASAGLILAVLVILILAEAVAGMRRRHNGELSPLEALEARITRQPAP